jgi:hypothetical protein
MARRHARIGWAGTGARPGSNRREEDEVARRRNQADARGDAGPDDRGGPQKGRPAPKGRPTPGRRQRAEAARKRARRRQLQVYAWWGLLVLLIVGTLVFFAVTGIGGGPADQPL